MAKICNFIWSLVWISRPLFVGLMSEQLFKIMEKTTFPTGTTLKMPYPGARLKQKATATLAHQPQSKEEITLKTHPYHVPLRTPVTQELPPKWDKMKKCSTN